MNEVIANILMSMAGIAWLIVVIGGIWAVIRSTVEAIRMNRGGKR